MLKVESIKKIYAETPVLEDISFELQGGVLGIIGVKGAGKSALSSIISGATEATEGKVYIDEYDISEYPAEAKRATGYLSGTNPLYDGMTPYEHLIFMGEAKKVPSEKLHKQADEALDLLGLGEVKDVLIKKLDKSERQLLGVASTLLGNPDIIILDEPLLGVSPCCAQKLSSIIKMLGTLKTVIITAESTSYLTEVCDRFLLLSEEGAELIDAESVVADTNNEEAKECEE